MKKNIAFVCFILASTAVAQAQDLGKIDVYLGTGFRASSSTQLTLSDYKTMFPGSTILQKDLSAFSSSNYFIDNVSPMINVLWGVRTKVNGTNEQRLRVGFSYSHFTSHSLNLYYQNRLPYDTLTSSQTGQSFFVDSVYSENVYISNSQDVISLDASYILRSNAQGRLSFFAGIGVEVGAMINSKASVFFDNYSYFDGYYGGNFYNSNDHFDYVSEEYSLDPGFYTQMYMPLGVDFRISKTSDFWKRMHIYTELRPGLQYANFANLSPELKFNIGVAMFGLRHEF